MDRTLQLKVPEEIYASLVEAAQKAGQQPEAVAVQWLADAVQKVQPYDPMEQFIGAFVAPPEFRDWAENHDKYLGENLSRGTSRENDEKDA